MKFQSSYNMLLLPCLCEVPEMYTIFPIVWTEAEEWKG